MPRHANCLLGALVADAASLGLHWIYDVARIAEIEARHGHVAFVPHDPAHFRDVPAYDAHAARAPGDQTQYGETLRLAIDCLGRARGFDVTAYQDAFVAHFGPGGAYRGYIDRPTRGTLDNIIAGRRDPSGIDDDQLPALATLPALSVVYAGMPDYADQVGTAIRVTNVHPDADAYGNVAADLLARLLSGATLLPSLRAAAEAAPAPIRTVLIDALDSAEPDSVAYGEITKRACHLPMGMPLVFHILARAPGYAEAVCVNIRAGGDSAGRALLIGAAMGAVHGLDPDSGIPLDWTLSLHDPRGTWTACRALAALRG